MLSKFGDTPYHWLGVTGAIPAINSTFKLILYPLWKKLLSDLSWSRSLQDMQIQGRIAVFPSMKDEVFLPKPDAIPNEEDTVSFNMTVKQFLEQAAPYCAVFSQAPYISRLSGVPGVPEDHPAMFCSKEAVEHYFKEYAKRSGHGVKAVKPIGVCKRCGGLLFPPFKYAAEQGYVSQCFDCEEDFFGIEQFTPLRDEAVTFMEEK